MIDKDKLRELAADPKNKVPDIWAGLGFNNDAAFYYHLNKDAEAKRIFKEGRKAVITARSGGDAGALPDGRASARRPKRRAGKKSKKKAAKRAAPPPQRSCQSRSQRRTAPQDSARV
jgi:hypothetical protein